MSCVRCSTQFRIAWSPSKESLTKAPCTSAYTDDEPNGVGRNDENQGEREREEACCRITGRYRFSAGKPSACGFACANESNFHLMRRAWPCLSYYVCELSVAIASWFSGRSLEVSACRSFPRDYLHSAPPLRLPYPRLDARYLGFLLFPAICHLIRARIKTFSAAFD